MNHDKNANHIFEDNKINRMLKLMNNREDVELQKELVKIVPEDYYAWHVISDSFEVSKDSILSVSLVAIFNNPKSYSAWHHRFLAVASAGISEEEDYLTRMALKNDPRNFHVWSYRRKLKLNVIRDLLNYSCLSDLVSRNQVVDAISLIYADPYYFGGYRVLRFNEENCIHIKDFKDFTTINFPTPFLGEIKIKETIFDIKFPVLQHKMAGIESFENIEEVYINNKKYEIRKIAREKQFVEDLLKLEPECVPLLIEKFINIEEDSETLKKLCYLDKIRRNWYLKMPNKYYSLFELVECV